jgi:hypothetical protein
VFGGETGSGWPGSAHFRHGLAPFFDYHDLAAHYALNNRTGPAMQFAQVNSHVTHRLTSVFKENGPDRIRAVPDYHLCKRS